MTRRERAIRAAQDRLAWMNPANTREFAEDVVNGIEATLGPFDALGPQQPNEATAEGRRFHLHHWGLCGDYCRPQQPKEESDQRITHGRHCTCSACARENWTNPDLACCGMHGRNCAPFYQPLGPAGMRTPKRSQEDENAQ